MINVHKLLICLFWYALIKVFNLQNNLHKKRQKNSSINRQDLTGDLRFLPMTDPNGAAIYAVPWIPWIYPSYVSNMTGVY